MYRFELDSALVDDGDRLFRIRRTVFEHLIERARHGAHEEVSGDLAEFVVQHPTVFEFFFEADEAGESLHEKEV